MIHGGCLCGAVTYEYDGGFGTVTICHCSDCRRAQGSASVIAAPVDAVRLRWTAGQDLITEYESSPGKKRAFCKRCGSPLYSRRDDFPQTLRLRVGSIAEAAHIRPAAHIFVSELPAWAALEDDLPRYERHEPGWR